MQNMYCIIKILVRLNSKMQPRQYYQFDELYDTFSALNPQQRIIQQSSPILRDHLNYRVPQIDPKNVKIPFPFKNIIEGLRSKQLTDKNKAEIRLWLVNMFEMVTSDAFLKYHRAELGQRQFRVYSAKNYIFNIMNFMKAVEQKKKGSGICQQTFTFIDNQSKNIINQLIVQFPQSQTRYGVRKLKKILDRIDNTANEKFDLLRYPPVIFTYKKGDNYSYTSEIMQTLNYIMQISGQPLHQSKQAQTNFDGFHTLMDNIFNFAGQKQFQTEFFNKIQKYLNQQFKINKQKVFQEFSFNKTYKKATQQCYFKINHKIPADVKLFDSEQISSGAFRVPDVSLLRVMTKWVKQLSDTIFNAPQKIMKRAERFKNIHGQFVELSPDEKLLLCAAIEQGKSKIIKIRQEIQQNYKIMGTKLLADSYQCLYTNNEDGNIGIFAARTQNCIGRYLLVYLNQLIHFLLTIPKKATLKLPQQKPFENSPQKNIIKVKREKLLSLNLISFKAGDLLRSKCKANEKHIIQIYKLISKVHQQFPKFIKIINVKDRLDGKDKDVLINIFLLNKLQCQIQLSVATDINPKQQHYNNFNHFIYQLKRSLFGPISQCACILAQYDPRIKNYSQREDLAPAIQQKIVPSSQPSMIQSVNINKTLLNNLPFFCQVCKKFNRNLNPHFYLNVVNTKQCNQCYEKRLENQKNNQSLLKQILRQKYNKKEQIFISKHFSIVNTLDIQVDQFKKIQKGLIISKSSDKPNPQYFQVVYFNNKYYIVSPEFIRGIITIKIVCELNSNDSIQQWRQKLKSKFILKLNNEPYSQFEILPQSPMISLKFVACSCCQMGFSVGYQIKTQQETIKILNYNFIQNVQLRHKQDLYIVDRKINKQLEEINQMQSVRRFCASNNTISSMKFLTKFNNLIVINLSSNKINKIENTHHLNKLKYLDLGFNLIKQINGLEKCVAIQSLILEKNDIAHIKGLQNLKYLQNLNLSNNKISTIQGISLSSIVNLQLSFNLIQKIKNLDKMKYLKHLNLCGNKIQLIQNLSNLEDLISLDLSNNNIDKMTGIQSLKNLNILNLRANKIAVISTVNKLFNLTTLILQENSISKIQNLQNLRKLQILDLSENNIQKIQGIKQLYNLKTLDLGSNSIGLIQGLEHLIMLSHLSLIHNKRKPNSLQLSQKEKELIQKLINRQIQVQIDLPYK